MNKGRKGAVALSLTIMLLILITLLMGLLTVSINRSRQQQHKKIFRQNRYLVITSQVLMEDKLEQIVASGLEESVRRIQEQLLEETSPENQEGDTGDHNPEMQVDIETLSKEMKKHMSNQLYDQGSLHRISLDLMTSRLEACRFQVEEYKLNREKSQLYIKIKSTMTSPEGTQYYTTEYLYQIPSLEAEDVPNILEGKGRELAEKYSDNLQVLQGY